jgi:hypothetical protein
MIWYLCTLGPVAIVLGLIVWATRGAEWMERLKRSR